MSMPTEEETKKRKLESSPPPSSSPREWSQETLLKIISFLTPSQSASILASASTSHPDVLAAIGTAVGKPQCQKLFVRGLGYDITSESLRRAFEKYGELEEGMVITDKATGKSRGFGFITFKCIPSCLAALANPTKKIEGRSITCQLAASGPSPALGNPGSEPVNSVPGPLNPGSSVAGSLNLENPSLRKIYVGNVPPDCTISDVTEVFSEYGRLEEPPIGFEKGSGKSKGYALILYEAAEGARAALERPHKTIRGQQVYCKLASEGGKGKKKERERGDVVPGGNFQGQNQGQFLPQQQQQQSPQFQVQQQHQQAQQFFSSSSSPLLQPQPQQQQQQQQQQQLQQQPFLVQFAPGDSFSDASNPSLSGGSILGTPPPGTHFMAAPGPYQGMGAPQYVAVAPGASLPGVASQYVVGGPSGLQYAPLGYVANGGTPPGGGAGRPSPGPASGSAKGLAVPQNRGGYEVPSHGTGGQPYGAPLPSGRPPHQQPGPGLLPHQQAQIVVGPDGQQILLQPGQYLVASSSSSASPSSGAALPQPRVSYGIQQQPGGPLLQY